MYLNYPFNYTSNTNLNHINDEFFVNCTTVYDICNTTAAGYKMNHIIISFKIKY